MFQAIAQPVQSCEAESRCCMMLFFEIDSYPPGELEAPGALFPEIAFRPRSAALRHLSIHLRVKIAIPIES